ncbi:MAG: hypothetical protein A1D16_13415 [Flavihumibacter sp. CACIAM 22H1]|nr:MAG: hypothetical protein A1D16_13415 [Flavihumibacter sp. CACIAM 22H1]
MFAANWLKAENLAPRCFGPKNGVPQTLQMPSNAILVILVSGQRLCLKSLFTVAVHKPVPMKENFFNLWKAHQNKWITVCLLWISLCISLAKLNGLKNFFEDGWGSIFAVLMRGDNTRFIIS